VLAELTAAVVPGPGLAYGESSWKVVEPVPLAEDVPWEVTSCSLKSSETVAPLREGIVPDDSRDADPRHQEVVGRA